MSAGVCFACIAILRGSALVGGVDVSVRQKLAEARGRLIGRQFLTALPWALLAGGMALVLVRAGVFYWPKFRSVAWMGVFLIMMPLAVVWIAAAVRWWSTLRVAQAVDAAAPTKDRFLTILQHGEGSAMGRLLREEVERFIREFDIRAHLPLRWPGRQFLWLVLPVAMLAGLEFAREWREAHPHPQLVEAQELLEKMRQAAAKQEDLKEVEKELEKKKGDLAEAADPLREALRTMAALDEKLAANASGLTAEETEALADALEASNAQLAQNLRDGQQAEAARQLSEMDPNALADALKQAAQHLENKRLQEMAQQSPGQMKSSLQRMVKGEGNGQGSQFRAAMRDIKNGAGDQQQPGEGDQPNEAPPGDEKSNPSTADSTPPGGAPGTEKDLGQGKDIAGETEPAAAPTAADDSLIGQQGDGTSVVQMLRMTGADDPKARTAYRSAYQTAEAAALDAVNREEVPIGSRLLVRKYFEAIRPKK